MRDLRDVIHKEVGQKASVEISIWPKEARVLDRINSSPFATRIENMDPPKKFSPLKFNIYDGRSDMVIYMSAIFSR